MAAYLIAQIRMDDRDEYREYEAGFLEVLTGSGGEILAVDEATEILEGEWPYTRTVIIRFPDAAAAHRWYDSAEYQSLAQHRLRASRGNIVLTRGLQ